MKKIAILLMISLFVFASCSKDEPTPTPTPTPNPIPVTATPTEVKAVLGVNGMTISWKAIEGTGITYNVYRNDSGIKINTSPLTTTTFTDLLSAAGDYTYSVVAISASGVESTKSTVSAPVVLSVVKTRVSTGLDTYKINGIYVSYNKTTTTVYTYNGLKFANVVTTSTADNPDVPKTETKNVYTYTGNLITKIESFNNLTNVLTYIYDYSYNESGKLMSRVSSTPTGTTKSNVAYSYNTDGSVITAAYSSIVIATGESKPGYTETYTYSNGNLANYTRASTNYSYNFTMTYDVKNNPYFNILGYTKINLYTGINNMLTENDVDVYDGVPESSSYRFECTYDTNGYILTSKGYSKMGTKPETAYGSSIYTY